jgi:hypothetical protein
MPFVSGFLRMRRHGGHPDQGLPGGEGGIDPGYGIDIGEEGGALPDHELPQPPPGIWPPPVSIWPPTPLPPDYPMPPGSIWPPVRPTRPDQGLPRPPIQPGQPGQPDQGLPGQPPHVGGGPVIPSHKFLVAIVALGAGGPRVIGYTVVDPSLSPTHPIAPGGPTAQPK